MNETKFLDIKSNYRLAYIKNDVESNAQPIIIFIHGFRSDKNGTKVQELYKFTTSHNLLFVAFDLRNHGESSGEHEKGCISDWLNDCLTIIDRFATSNCILIGSSLGGWLMLLVARLRPHKIHSLIGIAAAPDFTEKLVWNNLSSLQQNQLMIEGNIRFVNEKSASDYYFEKDMIIDARAYLLLDSNIEVNCPVRLLHGMNDIVISFDTSIKIAELITSQDVEINLIKNGDHRLSMPNEINLLNQTLLSLI